MGLDDQHIRLIFINCPYSDLKSDQSRGQLLNYSIDVLLLNRYHMHSPSFVN
jgi:hypothetical protein